MEFKKAVRKQRKLRAAICGVSGSGKTYTALRIAKGIGGKIGLIDSERNSASLYSEDFDFDSLDLTELTIDGYFKAIDIAAVAGFNVLIIDSASHAWEGVLERVDQAATKNRGSSFNAWGSEGTPLYKKFLAKILTLPMHVILTMRSKSEYTMEEYTDQQGRKKSRPVKIGLAPEFRKGGEYEFDIVANIDLSHNFTIDKTRMKFLDNAFINCAGEDLGKQIITYLDSGEKDIHYYNLSAIAEKPEVKKFVDSIKANITEYVTPVVIETDIGIEKLKNYEVSEQVAQELLKAYEVHKAAESELPPADPDAPFEG